MCTPWLIIIDVYCLYWSGVCLIRLDSDEQKLSKHTFFHDNELDNRGGRWVLRKKKGREYERNFNFKNVDKGGVWRDERRKCKELGIKLCIIAVLIACMGIIVSCVRYSLFLFLFYCYYCCVVVVVVIIIITSIIIIIIIIVIIIIVIIRYMYIWYVCVYVCVYMAWVLVTYSLMIVFLVLF